MVWQLWGLEVLVGARVILVDEPRLYPETRLRHKTWSHMVTDSDSFDELHAMAKKIGLRREWFQFGAPGPWHAQVDDRCACNSATR
jgi:hypothetical protein